MIPITQIKSIVPPTAVPTVWAVVKDGIPEVFGKLIKTDSTGDNEAEDVADNEGKAEGGNEEVGEDEVK